MARFARVVAVGVPHRITQRGNTRRFILQDEADRLEDQRMLALEQRMPPPAPRRAPFYRRDWFWAAVGVVAISTAIILVSVSSAGNPDAPASTLGNMHAF